MRRGTRSPAFEEEVFFALRRQRALFAGLALIALVIAATCVAAVILMLPLREVRPYVIMVDTVTGEAQQVYAVQPANLAEQEAVREAELYRYVTDRETYDPTDNRTRIRDVLERSTEQAAESLVTLWNSASELYPPDRYGRQSLITVRVTSIVLLDGNTAQIRFIRHLEQPGIDPVVRDFVATIGFTFNPRVERNLELVWQNPLGFTVTSYRVDAETLDPREAS